jgi:hypothetical protein
MKVVAIAGISACALFCMGDPALAADAVTNAAPSTGSALSTTEPAPPAQESQLTTPAKPPRKSIFSAPLKAVKNVGKKVVKVPAGIVRDMNPLAPLPDAEQQSLEPVEGVSPRAWTTVVGWYPGASAFPDPITQSAAAPR